MEGEDFNKPTHEDPAKFMRRVEDLGDIAEDVDLDAMQRQLEAMPDGQEKEELAGKIRKAVEESDQA